MRQFLMARVRLQQHRFARACRRHLTVWLCAVLVCGCTATAHYDPQTNDPLEPLNRGLYDFNRLADLLILEPVSKIYGVLVPDPVKSSLSNFLDNLRAPIIFANDVLQGETERAANTLGRFMINSVAGIGGLFDPATALGRTKHKEDFGQTLAVYGVGEGPYLMLPFLGPSNPRDALGRVVDGFLIDPVGYIAPFEVGLGRTALEGVMTRHRLGPVFDDLQKNALDPYATIRSIYRQQRQSDIRNGRPAPQESYDDIFDEDFDDELDDAAK